MLKRNDGSEFSVRLDCFRVTSANHDPMLRVTLTDITETKQKEADLREIEACKLSEQLLKEGENYLHNVFDATPDAMLISDVQGMITMANMAAVRLLGYSSNELLDLSIDDLVLEHFHAIHPAQHTKFSASELIHLLGKNGEVNALRKDGSEVNVEISLSPIQTKQGLFFASAMRDITGRKQLENRNNLLISALEAMANGIVITDKNATIQWVNSAFVRLTGYSQEESIGKPGKLTKSDVQDRIFYESMWKTILANKIWHGELVNRRKDGSLYNEEMTITPLLNEQGCISHFVAVKQEITERIASVTYRIIDSQEKLQRRLSSELHDRTSPNLAAININLNTLTKELPQEYLINIIERIEDTCALVADTGISIREICADMRPPLLDYAGLAEAIRSYTQQFTQRTGITVQFDCLNDDERYAPELESMLFRIFQEAMTNCLKHAHATLVVVTLSNGGHPITLTITDNGNGFDAAGLVKNAHVSIGLLNMREMAIFSKGEFLIDSVLGKGTKITVIIL